MVGGGGCCWEVIVLEKNGGLEGGIYFDLLFFGVGLHLGLSFGVLGVAFTHGHGIGGAWGIGYHD